MEDVLLVTDTFSPPPYPGAFICFVIDVCDKRMRDRQ
jgi:hypothetical protein